MKETSVNASVCGQTSESWRPETMNGNRPDTTSYSATRQSQKGRATSSKFAKLILIDCFPFFHLLSLKIDS